MIIRSLFAGFFNAFKKSISARVMFLPPNTCSVLMIS
nr:MAG TPA: hypothetical protein [Bacteriophage sp.]